MNKVEEVMVKCYECDDEVGTYIEYEYSDIGEPICESCHDDAVSAGRECYECGEVHSDNDDLYTTHSDDMICDDCLNTGIYVWAYDSSGDYALIHENDAIVMNDEYYTDDVPNFQCEDCGDRFPESEDYGDTCWLCRDCAEDEHRTHHLVRDYQDNPRTVFYGEQSNGRYVGVELELDYGDVYHFADSINEEIEPRIYLMEDSSLSCNNQGVEVISQPMSYDEHMNSGLWDKVSELANEYGFEDDASTCGIHAHVSRDSFHNSESIENLVYLVNRFWTRMVTYSGRSMRKIEEWADRDIKNKDEREVTKGDIKEVCERRRSRYSAINLSNPSTIEFRMFAGSTSSLRIKSIIQFVYLLSEVADHYARNDMDIETLEWSRIVKHAKINPHYYIAYCDMVELGLE